VKSSAKTKKLTQEIPEEYTTVVIDQTGKAVGSDLYRAWFPVGERVQMPYWRTYESVRLLGEITENGETFFTEVADSFNSDVTVRMLQSLQYTFGEKKHVIFDNATYFTSNKVAEFVDDSVIKVTHLPTGSPDMNPVEECWGQLRKRPRNRFFGSVDELRPAIRRVLNDLNPPRIFGYLFPSG
jgi:transposase